MPLRLIDRHPALDRAQLIADLVPPRHFAESRFANYLPDPQFPSQAQARGNLEEFSRALGATPRKLWSRRLGFSRTGTQGRYLDGGFGIGKTHLLAALWHSAPEPKAFGTFMEFTNLAGALGFSQLVQTFSSYRLVCIDEFELDDPGDTVLISTLLGKLMAAGVQLAATSNTLPGALGQGRFAAADFTREIQSLAAGFTVLTVDGPDFRQQAIPDRSGTWVTHQVHEATAANASSCDDFTSLIGHLATLHPSRYRALVADLDLVGWTDVHQVRDQWVGLRLVALADRLYDTEIPLVLSGCPVEEIFAPELLRSGYRKKYLRAISRLRALNACG